jgi:hypothetical protein
MYVLSRVCPDQGVSCPEFVESRVCRVKGLSSPGFVESRVCLSKVCLSRVCRCIFVPLSTSDQIIFGYVCLN